MVGLIRRYWSVRSWNLTQLPDVFSVTLSLGIVGKETPGEHRAPLTAPRPRLHKASLSALGPQPWSLGYEGVRAKSLAAKCLLPPALALDKRSMFLFNMVNVTFYM